MTKRAHTGLTVLGLNGGMNENDKVLLKPSFRFLLLVITGMLLAFLLTSAVFCAGAQPASGGAGLSNRVSITIEGELRVIRANGLPDHAMGQFPNAHNPNSASAQNYVYRVPVHPQVAARATPVGMQNFGIAINGVTFDPAAAEWWHRDRSSGWQYEPMTGHLNLGVDQNNAHVQPNGAYHYHGLPTGLLAKVKDAKSRMVLLGWAADGFPIYAPWGYAKANDATSRVEDVEVELSAEAGDAAERAGRDLRWDVRGGFRICGGGGRPGRVQWPVWSHA